MKFLVGAVLVLAAVVYGSNAGRIVGGSAITISDIPSIVQVERNTLLWAQMCAGNVITSTYILSGASCFSGILFDIRNRRVRAGTTFRGVSGVVVELVRVINHPTYNSATFNGDISVVQLATPLIYSQNIQPQAIIAQGFQLPDNLPVDLAGWGSSEINGAAALLLQKASVLTVNHDVCAERYASLEGSSAVVTESMLCAGLLDVGGADACQGDSGGPLIFDDILVGIISWGNGCASAAYPGVYTNVAYYTNWVIDTVG